MNEKMVRVNRAWGLSASAPVVDETDDDEDDDDHDMTMEPEEA